LRCAAARRSHDAEHQHAAQLVGAWREAARAEVTEHGAVRRAQVTESALEQPHCHAFK
jgi:hypothetical protein